MTRTLACLVLLLSASAMVLSAPSAQEYTSEFSTFYNGTSNEYVTVLTNSVEAAAFRSDSVALLSRDLAERGGNTNCKGSGLCKSSAGSAQAIRDQMCQGGCRFGSAGTHIRTACNGLGLGLALFSNGPWDEGSIIGDVDDIIRAGCKKCGSTDYSSGRLTINYVSKC